MGILDFFTRKPTQEQFAKLMLDELATMGHLGLHYDQANFAIQMTESNCFFLNNAYNAYCQAPAGKRKSILTGFAKSTVETLVQLPEDFTVAKRHLLPRIRERVYYPLVQGQLQNFPCPPVKDFSEYFTVEVCYDGAFSICTPQQTQFDTWGVSFDEALNIARDNLWAKSNEDWQQLASGVYLSPWQDVHDVSRLYLPTLFRQLRLHGEPVAFLPSRNHLIVTGVDDQEGLVTAAKTAQKIFRKDPRPMTGEALRLAEDHWVSYLPPTSHPAYRICHELQLESRWREYAEQKKMIDSQHDREGTDIYVASYDVRQLESGEQFSYTIWVRGVDTLMPQTERVIFIEGGNEKKVLCDAPWERVVEVVGSLMTEQQELYPKRYRVVLFPSKEQLQALGVKVG